jgi:predicted GIY-YIG superfamily endonuclease
MASPETTVYLLHFDRPHPEFGWQHYIGWTRNLPARILAHRTSSSGSRVARECRRAGIGF